MKDCRECKSYKDCEGHIYIVDTDAGRQYVNWYHYGEIRWCPYQVMFILESSETLLLGDWPERPEGSSYTDPMIKTGFPDEAYFTKPEEAIGEVEYRLARVTRDAREALIDAANRGIVDLKELSRPAHRALLYVKGKNRKKKNYTWWVRKVYDA